MMNTLLMLSRFANKTFALWVIIAGILGFVFPDVFKPIGSWIAILLGVMMFGMGLTLTTADFREIFRRPKDVFVGILAQFLIMPLAAFVLCKAFALPPDLAVGLMLLGCVPGGTASNLVTFLARGDVALSVTITSCTTLLAPLVTPALMYFFANQWIAINPTAMFLSIVQVILLPIAAGVVVHKVFGKKADQASVVLPFLCGSAVCVCCYSSGDHRRGRRSNARSVPLGWAHGLRCGGAAECFRHGTRFPRRSSLWNGCRQMQGALL